MAEEGQGFLGRWARRKTEVLRGKAPPEPAATEKPARVIAAAPLAIKNGAINALPAGATAPKLPEKTLSLDDAKLLTGESDFKPFMAGNVGPEVRNAAMKKLFTDPHYHVMDGLDIYIDDYSISDPIPQAMLRQMVGAKLLRIFDDEEDEPGKEDAPAPPPEEPLPSVNLNSPAPETLAESGVASAPARQESLPADNAGQPELFTASGASSASQNDDHAHSHLRLQPDHASSALGAGRGAA